MRLVDGYVVFTEASFVELRLLLLTGFLLAAAVIDACRRRIPNLLVLGGLCTAFAYHLIDPVALGWQRAVSGMALGFGMLLPFYLLRGMAAGDVKLMAMVGAFLGLQATFWAVVATFLVGGIWALLLVFGRSSWAQLLVGIRTALHPGAAPALAGAVPDGMPLRRSAAYLPYGVAIAAGTLMSLVWSRGGLSLF